ncbi:MAG: hypothetical protein NTW83_06190 [Cyanobacteria bacterium]|nr:hypothetical protein [Cyanobacteriota bacterium]
MANQPNGCPDLSLLSAGLAPGFAAAKLVSQVNVMMGSGYNANATGFSPTISVFGCR